MHAKRFRMNQGLRRSHAIAYKGNWRTKYKRDDPIEKTYKFNFDNLGLFISTVTSKMHVTYVCSSEIRR